MCHFIWTNLSSACNKQTRQSVSDRQVGSVREMRASCVCLSVSWWMPVVMTPQRTQGNRAGNKATNYSGHDGPQWSVIRRVRHVTGSVAVTELAMRHADISWLTENRAITRSHWGLAAELLHVGSRHDVASFTTKQRNRASYRPPTAVRYVECGYNFQKCQGCITNLLHIPYIKGHIQCE